LETNLTWEIHDRRPIVHRPTRTVRLQAPANNLTYHHCTSIPSVKTSFPVSLVLISSSVQVNDGDENGVVETKFNSGVTFLFKERTDQSYPCTLLSQESHESSTRAIIPTRRTIAVPDSGDREDEYPSWILDALKVGVCRTTS
jgi:hypothetical protein